jgi:hypothetical protein
LQTYLTLQTPLPAGRVELADSPVLNQHHATTPKIGLQGLQGLQEPMFMGLFWLPTFCIPTDLSERDIILASFLIAVRHLLVVKVLRPPMIC